MPQTTQLEQVHVGWLPQGQPPFNSIQSEIFPATHTKRSNVITSDVRQRHVALYTCFLNPNYKRSRLLRTLQPAHCKSRNFSSLELLISLPAVSAIVSTFTGIMQPLVLLLGLTALLAPSILCATVGFVRTGDCEVRSMLYLQQCCAKLPQQTFMELNSLHFRMQ